jgi:hypothetical protein
MRRPRVVTTGSTLHPACLRFWTRTTSQTATIERLIAAFVPERHALFLEPANL